jgi:hypothetical protein
MIDPEIQHYLSAAWSLDTQAKVYTQSLPVVFDLESIHIFNEVNNLHNIGLDFETNYWICKEWMLLSCYSDLMQEIINHIQKDIQSEIDKEIFAYMKSIITNESLNKSKSFSFFNWFKSMWKH